MMKLAKITDPCLPPGTVMCFQQEEAPEGWEFVSKIADNLTPKEAKGVAVITCRKL